MAILGPVITSWSPNSGHDDYLYRESYRQTGKRKTLRLPYVFRRAYTVKREPVTGISQKASSLPWKSVSGENERALAAAYSRFKSNLNPSAALTVTLAERKQAVEMISSRAAMLWKFSLSLRKGRFEDAARALRMGTIPPGVSKAKSFGNNYLEFHFGWAPLVADIGNAVEVLQHPFLNITVKGRGNSTGEVYKDYFPGHPSNYWIRDRQVTKCQLIADVKVTNYNLWLANQLGFVNPALVVWELVPFSFVVDWFANVGDFLSQFTDFLGLELSNPATTYYAVLTRTSSYPRYGWVYEGKHTWVVRKQGLDTPVLQLKPFHGFSVRRGLAAVSLLLQAMK